MSPATIRALLSLLLAVATFSSSRATEFLSISNEFGITRDFSTIIIAGSEARTARLFIDPVRNVSPFENNELRPTVVGSLSDKVQVVSSKEDANYYVQVVMNRYTNYAIRNPAREPAHGDVLIGICKYPIHD